MYHLVLGCWQVPNKLELRTLNERSSTSRSIKLLNLAYTCDGVLNIYMILFSIAFLNLSNHAQRDCSSSYKDFQSLHTLFDNDSLSYLTGTSTYIFCSPFTWRNSFFFFFFFFSGQTVIVAGQSLWPIKEGFVYVHLGNQSKDFMMLILYVWVLPFCYQAGFVDF